MFFFVIFEETSGMAEHLEYGKMGEEKAVEYLIQSGYVILERNWRMKHKEIDIICTDGDLLVIVEVKSRKVPEERPDELLDRRKRHNLLCAGESYLKTRGIDKELRFDLILITGVEGKVEHIPGAITIFD